MHSNTTRKLHAIGVLAGLVSILALAGAVTAQGGSQDRGEVVWPGEGQRSSQELASLGESLFVNGVEPTVIGERPIESFRLERVNDSATRILVGERDGENHSFVQPHEPNPADRHTSLEIRPGDLRPTVEVRPNASVGPHDVLRVQGAPGSFGLEGDTVAEKIEAFADRLDFPLQERRTNVTKVSFPGLYGGNRVCLDGSESDCSVTADFHIDCPSCQMGSFDAPELSSKLERGLKGSGLFLFDGEGRMVAATVSYHLDLNESALMDLEAARDEGRKAVDELGHEVFYSPRLDDVTVKVLLEEQRVQVREVHYVWQWGVYVDSGEDEYRDDENAIVTQNAATGEVLSVRLEDPDITESDQGLLERAVPAPGAMAALLAAVGGAALARRRRAS